MRGFVVYVSNIHDSHKKFTLTTEGILFLAERGHFLKTSKRSIHGKTKPDFLAKGLICIQVRWLVVQCMARKLSGHPISILETHTFVHIVIALSMFILWLRVCINKISTQEPAWSWLIYRNLWMSKSLQSWTARPFKGQSLSCYIGWKPLAKTHTLAATSHTVAAKAHITRGTVISRLARRVTSI